MYTNFLEKSQELNRAQLDQSRISPEAAGSMTYFFYWLLAY